MCLFFLKTCYRNQSTQVQNAKEMPATTTQPCWYPHLGSLEHEMESPGRLDPKETIKVGALNVSQGLLFKLMSFKVFELFKNVFRNCKMRQSNLEREPWHFVLMSLAVVMRFIFVIHSTTHTHVITSCLPICLPI